MRASKGIVSLPPRAIRGPGRKGLHILVMAKSPVPGQVKTRLCPPLSPEEAAFVAQGCLEQTLQAVSACSAPRKLLALDGQPGSWIPPGFVVFPQRGDTFARRLTNAWVDADGAGLQIGMDTPQVTPELLNECLGVLHDGPTTAALGLALDGGWWALGRASAWATDVFTDVRMSTEWTGLDQLRSLEAAGYHTRLLPTLRDLDTIEDARAIAAAAPGSKVASVLGRIESLHPDRCTL